MEWGRGQPLLATDDMGDFHQVVVDDVGQVIGRQLVGTLVEHLVIEDVALHTHLTANQVVDQYLLSGFNLETDYVLMAGSHQLFHFLLWKGQRVTHLTTGVGVVLEILDFGTLGFQLLGGVEGDVSLVGIQQLLNIFLIDVAALTLTVGTFVTSEGYTLVELDAQPLERLDDIFLGTGYETIGVGVLDTEHQIAAVLLGKQIIIQGGTYTANM